MKASERLHGAGPVCKCSWRHGTLRAGGGERGQEGTREALRAIARGGAGAGRVFSEQIARFVSGRDGNKN